MQLLQILLPLRDDKGRSFPKRHYENVANTLTERFGGMTAYTRTPAEGRWKDSGDTVSEDDIVVFEVMVDLFETTWWTTYRKTLEKRFGQKNIVIRAQDIRIL
jgi:hypothetical protein